MRGSSEFWALHPACCLPVFVPDVWAPLCRRTYLQRLRSPHAKSLFSSVAKIALLAGRRTGCMGMVYSTDTSVGPTVCVKATQSRFSSHMMYALVFGGVVLGLYALFVVVQVVSPCCLR